VVSPHAAPASAANHQSRTKVALTRRLSVDLISSSGLQPPGFGLIAG
jgi:hypothetical protein